MRHRLSIVFFGIFIFISSSTFASTSKVAGAVVENMPSADVIKFVISPIKGTYEHKVICGNDSIRVRFQDIGLDSKEIKILPVPRGSYLSRVRIVPQMQNKSVLQIHPKGLTLEACARTSVMTIDGNLIVSMALTDVQKKRRGELLGLNETQENEEDAENGQRDEMGLDTEVAVTRENVEQRGKTADDVKVDSKKVLTDDSTKDRFAGTIFDKATKQKTALKSDEQLNSQTMKYAGGLLFAALIGFLAWYLKKKKTALKIIEDNIDILSSKKVSSHQQLMVARVNGAKFLLAVGDKTVTSLGLIPSAESDVSTANTLQSQIDRAVQDSLAREPKISSTPYCEIEDDSASDTQPKITSGFGDDFRNAIEKIARDRDKPTRAADKSSAIKKQREMVSVDRDYSVSEVPSNVSGLLSMARMRASFDQRNKHSNDEFRA